MGTPSTQSSLKELGLFIEKRTDSRARAGRCKMILEYLVMPKYNEVLNGEGMPQRHRSQLEKDIKGKTGQFEHKTD